MNRSELHTHPPKSTKRCATQLIKKSLVIQRGGQIGDYFKNILLLNYGMITVYTLYNKKQNKKKKNRRINLKVTKLHMHIPYKIFCK